MPRAASAAVRSASSSKETSSTVPCQRAPDTVRVRTDDAEPGGGSAPSVMPGANLRSGSSVRTSTVTSPRRPNGFPIRPTTTSTSSEGPSAASVDIHEVDPRAALAGQRRDHGAEGGRGAAAATDHLPEGIGGHPNLEDRAATQLLVAHHDVVGVVDHAADEMLQRVCQHGGQLSALAASASAASASSALSAAPSGVSSAGTGAVSSAASSAAGASSAGGSSLAGSSFGASSFGAAFFAAAFFVTGPPAPAAWAAG